ncbi:aldehyde dehydrogenase [Fulvivirgaceae bacterium BMA10]|uniref:Aldehyde dehydrogenase n=1 Tax=Splendidivirga corallicola TaxID=3051826 RepID=A0ABT8KPG8_9BACT|nr:aldehyde dehydrogenase [Fulvivirgaceae bacterium BMA10]
MNDIKTLLEKQRTFFLSGTTRKVKDRLKKLKQLKKVIKANEEQIYEALEKDFRKSDFETYVTEIGLVYEEINLFVKNLEDWSEPENVRTPITNFKGSSYIYSVPYGQVLIISPWNYPFYLAIMPLIGAVAAGNTVIVKPSEITEHTSKVIKDLISMVFDQAHVAIIEGGVEVSQALLAERFDYIFFTGSEVVGKIVAKAAAEYLTPVTLELGGKSPCIVDKDANLRIASRRIVWGKFLNGGQTCVAPDYLLVHRDVKAKFIEHLKRDIERFYSHDPKTNHDFPRIINLKHFERITKLIDQNKVIAGGVIDADECYIAPTLIDQVIWEDPIMREEIFGPVLPIIEFTEFNRIIDQINQRPEPLALYYFSNNPQKQNRIIQEVSFGGGCINDTLVHLGNTHLPFGGVGNSGMGAYHGLNSYETFSQKKSIIKKATWIDVPLRYPPYKGKLSLIKKIMR